MIYFIAYKIFLYLYISTHIQNVLSEEGFHHLRKLRLLLENFLFSHIKVV